VKIIADTNVLVRVIVQDDPEQSRTALRMLEQAETIAVSLHALCELTWVLRGSYGVSRADIAAAIRQLVATRNFEANHLGVEAGLTMLDAGGDFADGVIAYEGSWLGGDIFVSFDRKVIALIAKQGKQTRLLA